MWSINVIKYMCIFDSGDTSNMVNSMEFFYNVKKMKWNSWICKVIF